MKIRLTYFSLASTVLMLAASCEQDESSEEQLAHNYAIKSVASDGRTTSVFKYNSQGKITAWETLFFYNSYSYDSEGRLSRSESAIDSAVFSAVYVEKTALLTSENSTMNSYQTFSYSPDGTLAEIESYAKQDGDFVVVSTNSFEYENERITRVNLHDEEGRIGQFSTYEYDDRGNVKKENYYAYQATATPTLMSESTFEYDDQRNPFSVFKALSNPGIFTNPNNVTKVYSVSHENAASSEGRSMPTTYFYNQRGYPIKVVSDNSEFAYTY